LRVLTVVGNRPQFVKAAPLSRALRARGTEILVHTGQHYDPALADLFFDELAIPEPDHHLGIGPGTPVEQIARMLSGLEPIVRREAPEAVVVLGDTTTTLAGALTAAKLDIPIAHVEAGLRSFDRSMPEEQNRVVTDHLSALLLCPTESAVENLEREGVREGVHLVGDVMFDACLMFGPVAARRDAAAQYGVEAGAYVLVTVHRAAATDTLAALQSLVSVLEAIDGPAIFPVHPRTQAKLADAGLLEHVTAIPGLSLVPPAGYLDFMSLLVSARAVLTDSGGVQKEAYFHGVPCVTVRDTTEWVETVRGGFNTLTGMDPERVREALASPSMPETRPSYYGDGHAAEQIAQAIVDLTGRA
jgi:UDP-GlcNAc3NAcA epimerase